MTDPPPARISIGSSCATVRPTPIHSDQLTVSVTSSVASSPASMLPATYASMPMYGFDPAFNVNPYNYNMAAYGTPVAAVPSLPSAGAYPDPCYSKSDTDSNSSPQNNEDPRYRMKRDRNNEAAKKSRLNRKKRENDLGAKNQELAHENSQLKREVERLQQAVASLQKQLQLPVVDDVNAAGMHYNTPTDLQGLGEYPLKDDYLKKEPMVLRDTSNIFPNPMFH